MHHKETANGYLAKIAKTAIVRNKTKRDIDRSTAILSTKIDDHFGNKVREQLIFGSCSRKTMLPRRMDPYSDVDFMIVFDECDATPKTYLQRLRRFAKENYTRHEIVPAHPTIMLELNHIRFELVPAVATLHDDLLIPAKTTELEDWKSANPYGFHERLTKKNRTHRQQVLPLIRVMKYWNIIHNRPFDSFELEQAIVKTGYRNYWSLWFGGKWSLLSYVHQFSTVYKPHRNTQKHALQKLKILMEEVLQYVKEGNQGQAVHLLRKSIPLPT